METQTQESLEAIGSDLPSSDGVNTATVEDLRRPPVPEENPFIQAATQVAAKPKEPVLLDSIITGKRVRPVLIVVYGPPGIGKSTFGSQAPNPIFIPTERGLDQIGATRFPQPETFEEFRNCCAAIGKTKTHQFKTLVIDTADGLEALIWAEVCQEARVTSLEKIPYGRGFVAAGTRWRALLGSLVKLSEHINVLILCHSHIKSFDDPSLSDPYDMYRIKLHDKSAEILRDFCDSILFANYDITLQKDHPNDPKGRGLHSGKRIIKTQANTGFEAKNRYHLPEEIPLEWKSLEDGVEKFYAK